MSDTLKQYTDSPLIAADQVEGTGVFNRAGEKLGTVKDIYIDKRTGRAEFASMAFGGVLGMGEKYHPLPWAQLIYDTHLDGFVVDLDKTVLEGAPAYGRDRLEEDNYGWRTEVSGYYASFPHTPIV